MVCAPVKTRLATVSNLRCCARMKSEHGRLLFACAASESGVNIILETMKDVSVSDVTTGHDVLRTLDPATLVYYRKVKHDVKSKAKPVTWAIGNRVEMSRKDGAPYFARIVGFVKSEAHVEPFVDVLDVVDLTGGDGDDDSDVAAAPPWVLVRRLPTEYVGAGVARTFLNRVARAESSSLTSF